MLCALWNQEPLGDFYLCGPVDGESSIYRKEQRENRCVMMEEAPGSRSSAMVEKWVGFGAYIERWVAIYADLCHWVS